jgi:hypothetical protein
VSSQSGNESLGFSQNCRPREGKTTAVLMMNTILVLQSTNLSCQQSRSHCVASIWKWIGPIESESCSRARKRTTYTDGKY